MVFGITLGGGTKAAFALRRNAACARLARRSTRKEGQCGRVHADGRRINEYGRPGRRAVRRGAHAPPHTFQLHCNWEWQGEMSPLHPIGKT